MSTDSSLKILTLCLVCTQTHVLLAMKKRGFGAGRFNGFGGKVEPGETVEVAAAREMMEEGNIEPVSMQKVGLLTFTFLESTNELEVHVFKVIDFTGDPTESEEMKPQWFAWSDIPNKQMWVDDEYWLPFVQAGQCFTGAFLLDAPATPEHQGKIIQYTLTPVVSL